jgi:hypothetical protein
MYKKTQMQIMELSFTIMEKILVQKNFTNKDEVLVLIKNAVEITKTDAKLPTEVKMAYAEAYDKLQSLTWEEMQEIKKIIEE